MDLLQQSQCSGDTQAFAPLLTYSHGFLGTQHQKEKSGKWDIGQCSILWEPSKDKRVAKALSQGHKDTLRHPCEASLVSMPRFSIRDLQYFTLLSLNRKLVTCIERADQCAPSMSDTHKLVT